MPKLKRVTSSDLDDAVRIIRSDYYSEVRGIADEIIEAVKDGEITTQDALEERLHQEVDGSGRVIYTFKSKLGLLVSDNADAYSEEYGGEVPSAGGEVDYAILMAAALTADVREVLPSFDFDE